MTESHTFRDDDTTDAEQLVNYVRLIRSKQKETEEAQMTELMNAFRDGCCSMSVRLELVPLVETILKRAFLSAKMNEEKTQLLIEKEARRRAGIP